MKTNYYVLTVLFSLFILLSCQKEKQSPFVSQNYLKGFQTEKPQFFDLDTIEYKEIIGKDGTTIYFDRESFDVKDGEKIKLELIELYDFKEILYRGIQTVTTDAKLLESSGVLKVVFTSNGKELKLRKGELLKIVPPKGKLKDNDVFLSQQDSLGNITWDITKQNYSLFSITIGGGLWAQRIIDKDSISIYKKKNLASTGYETYNDAIKNELIVEDFFILENNTSKWINIDKLVKIDKRISFKLYDKKKEFSGFDIYTTYETINSFLHEPRLNDYLKFNDIPLSGKTFIAVIGENKGGVYYDKIELKETMNNTKLQLKMKKTSIEKLKKMFD